jgi:hypothetical protein
LPSISIVTYAVAFILLRRSSGNKSKVYVEKSENNNDGFNVNINDVNEVVPKEVRDKNNESNINKMKSKKIAAIAM